MARQSKKASTTRDNSLVQSAMDAIKQIDRETKTRKLAQAEALNTASAAIERRLEELQHQLTQIDNAISTIRGTPAAQPRRTRRDLSEDRQRVARWMEGRKGQKFAAGDLLREFPELEGAQISYLLKPLVQDGKIHTDTTEGSRRPKYFVTA